MALDMQVDRSGEMVNLEECIHNQQGFLFLCPIDHPDRTSTLNSLGNRLQTRFRRTGKMADLEDSIRHLQEALTLRPTGHPDRASTLSSLGIGLNLRFNQTRNMGDLGESIRHLQEALTLHPIGHLDRVSNLITLAIGLHARFDLTGNVADLEESNLHFQEALTLHPTGHPERASTLSNLGVGLNTCFDWTGNMGDLEESIRYHREALALCPAGHRERASILNNLGSSLDKRFEWTENVADLEESIGHHQEALTLRPIGDPDRPITLNNLANMLDTRFKRTGSMAELDESICYRQEALTLHPTDHPGREAILNNFGNSLRARFDRTENMADLEVSIRHHQEALTLNPIGHPGRALALNNLALCLNTQFRRTGSIADLEESIRHHQEALTLRPISNPDRATTLANLGAVLCGRFERTGDTADLEESIQCFMAAAGHALSHLASRLLGAVNWITAARQYGHESLAEAYSTYMDLLDRSLLLPASNIPDTHSHMVQIRGGRVNMTEDATSHAIKKHRLCEAVEIAERGRALLFTQLGSYRTPLDDLEIANKDLADRFRALSTVLDHSATSLPDTKTTLPVSGDPVARCQQMAADWDRTVNEIRQLDGFVGFLGATPFATLQKAAENGPVIIVNISRDGSDALIITTSEDPISVPLPDATPSAIRALANTLIVCTRSQADQPKSDQRLTEVLRELWAMVVAPVVLQLENTLDLPVGLRIWWMPTSFAWWLPLHAAGPYKSGKRNLPDRFVSSYTTTLSSLIRARAGYQPVKHVLGPRVLVIAQAEAEGQDQLPNVKVEVALICQLGTNVMVIEEGGCTKDAVLAGLRDMAWVYFSCHGHQLEQPFKSHFSLRAADALLTLLDIIQNDLPQAELAVLSACHSASGDPSAPNEVVNLAAGIMFAGFRSAVGTMWAIADKDGPVMADHFYKLCFAMDLRR
ncbi:hypothetical protein FRB93_000945 [Tulasnella sp. JGI-2019a]|nr:hypothetical protein FRB93_000945 [Tulasnella sp. JGI-2019a]